MVELVIKIPEDVYTRLFDNGIQDNEIAIDDICEMARALRQGTPLSEELEAIKAEFEEIDLLRDNPYNNETEYSVSVEELRELLDKHIAELKGIVDRIEEPVKKALSELKGEQK